MYEQYCWKRLLWIFQGKVATSDRWSDKPVTFSRQIFSGFSMPKIVKIGKFLTELLKKKRWTFFSGTQCRCTDWTNLAFEVTCKCNALSWSVLCYYAMLCSECCLRWRRFHFASICCACNWQQLHRLNPLQSRLICFRDPFCIITRYRKFYISQMTAVCHLRFLKVKLLTAMHFKDIFCIIRPNFAKLSHAVAEISLFPVFLEKCKNLLDDRT